MRTLHIFFAGAVFAMLGFPAADFAYGGELTAVELAKEGNRYVGRESRDKVVQSQSEKSFGTLRPNIWCVAYYDPDASGKMITTDRHIQSVD